MSPANNEASRQLQLPGLFSPEKSTVYFDLETQHSFDQVGGRHRIDKLRLSVAVIYDAASRQFRSYTEDQAMELIADLRQSQLVVGFNIRSFDYEVLRPYAGSSLSGIPTLDIMDHVVRDLGFRLSLDALALGTLGEGKSGDGLQAIRWFRAGHLDQLVAYCQKDVDIVRRLHEFGADEGCLYYFDRNGNKKRLPVKWDQEGA
ncbi:MAG: ribonuclease H-like domain-containing protein [Dehalococcoidia bacterium]|nr:ribonuclease H-like domain-containing protein [Dehalococcoidia bacterium]